MNDIVQNLNGSPVIYSNGTVVPSSSYTISSLGIATFTTAPAAGNVLTWSGKFYYRVRFKEDALDFPAFARNIYECDSLEFISKIL